MKQLEGSKESRKILAEFEADFFLVFLFQFHFAFYCFDVSVQLLADADRDQLFRVKFNAVHEDRNRMKPWPLKKASDAVLNKSSLATAI